MTEALCRAPEMDTLETDQTSIMVIYIQKTNRDKAESRGKGAEDAG